MSTLALIQVAAGPMAENLATSLAQDGPKPWALDRFLRQMRGIQRDAYVAFAWVTSAAGGALGRSGPVGDDSLVSRLVVGRITRSIRPVEDAFFEGFPFEFWYVLLADTEFQQPFGLDEASTEISAQLDGVDLDAGQLKEMISNGRSSKVGMFVDGGVRKAAYFAGYPDPTTEAEALPLGRVAAPREHIVTETPEGAIGQAALGFVEAVYSEGLVFEGVNADLPAAFFAGVLTKPFAILTGLSGSGKTRLAQALGRWLGPGADGHPRHLVVPVRADWTSPEPLLGYEDLLLEPKNGRRGWNVPAVLRFVLRAVADPGSPRLLILDEMNLAHVERYFADVLSGIESREPMIPNLELTDSVWRQRADAPALIPFPRNLIVVGTVNVDETTYQFSPKVLDRAFSFEFRVSSEELGAENRSPSQPANASDADLEAIRGALLEAAIDLRGPSDDLHVALVDLHRQLAEIRLEFGHRTMQEALRFADRLSAVGVNDPDEQWDWVVMTKILPRVHGSRRQLEEFLMALAAFAEGDDDEKPPRPLVARKAQRMLRALRETQFAGFSD